MNQSGLNTIKANINKNIDYEIDMIKLLFRSIPKRASRIYKSTDLSWSESMKQAWRQVHSTIIESRKEVNVLKAKLNRMFTPEQFHETTEGIQLSHYNLMNNLTK